MSGLVYTSGNGDDDPVPFGLAIADIICGAHLVQGILAALIRRHKKGMGAYIELSLLESLLDFQFELLTTYYANRQVPERSLINNGHPLLSAPYGIYATFDGYIAIAMVSIENLCAAIGCKSLLGFTQEETFSKRDEIKILLSDFLKDKPSLFWLIKLHKSSVWAMEVLDWNKMKDHEAYKILKIEQELNLPGGGKIVTTRCPIRINGERLTSNMAAPQLGEHNRKIKEGLLSKLEL